MLGGRTARECLDAGLLDEILVCVAPVMPGGGVRLLDRPDGPPVRLDRLAVDEAAQATNLWWRVRY